MPKAFPNIQAFHWNSDPKYSTQRQKQRHDSWPSVRSNPSPYPPKRFRSGSNRRLWTAKESIQFEGAQQIIVEQQ